MSCYFMCSDFLLLDQEYLDDMIIIFIFHHFRLKSLDIVLDLYMSFSDNRISIVAAYSLFCFALFSSSVHINSNLFTSGHKPESFASLVFQSLLPFL
jgi:hypothetical protein